MSKRFGDEDHDTFMPEPMTSQEQARAWGFEPWNVLTWCKPGLGVGRFQCNTEHVLVCRKGPRHGNPFGPTKGTWFTWDRGRHSTKPHDFYKLVETVSPGPYLEMFARVVRDGWDAIGNEVIAPGTVRFEREE